MTWALLASGLALTTPILLAAMGGLVNRRAGIVNIALEAKMLAGALAAVIVSSATGSWTAACVAAALTGLGIGLVFSWAITRLGANMIVAGLGLNLLVAGAIGFALAWVWGTSGTLRLPGVALLPRPAGTPFDPLTLFAWASVAALPFVLGGTRIGLWVRATGDGEAVARAVGLSPRAIQDASTAFAGAFAGLGGAHLALASIGLFNEGLTGGRGFIALAAFYFGRDRPWPTAGACLLFGLLDAGQIRMQTGGLPPQLVGLAPYLAVLAVLVAAGIRKGRTLP